MPDPYYVAPKVGDLCRRCGTRSMAVDRQGEPYSLCNVCATQDAWQEKLGLKEKGSFGLGYHETAISLIIRRCTCGCNEVYVDELRLDDDPFVGNISVTSVTEDVAHYGGPRAAEVDEDI